MASFADSISKQVEALPAGVVTMLVVLLAVQMVLMVAALIVMFQTPEERLIFGKRWVWVLIVVFGEIVGSIAFFAFARKPQVVIEPMTAGPSPDAPPAARPDAERVADMLYGEDAGERS